MAAFEVGDVIQGKYEVTAILGKGGMGLVLAARNRDLGELVALKFPLCAPDDVEASARFAREARNGSRIKNEHVARVYDVSTVGDAPFIVMEHLTGQDLSKVMAERGPLPVPEAVDLLLQACEAVADAHNLGIVHRDLKPANLFLTRGPDGTPLVKVLDFGLSKSRAPEDPALTATAAVMGSPLYMSPEQLRCSRDVDARTDVWSLGVILYEMLAGTTPFTGSSTALIHAAILNGPYAKLSTHRGDLPAALDELVADALARDSQARVPSVAAFAVRLAPFGSDAARASRERVERISARPASGPSPAIAVPPPSVAETSTGPLLAQPPQRRPPRATRTLALVATVAAAVGVSAIVRAQWSSAPAATQVVDTVHAGTAAPVAPIAIAEASSAAAVVPSAPLPLEPAAQPAPVTAAIAPRAPVRHVDRVDAGPPAPVATTRSAAVLFGHQK